MVKKPAMLFRNLFDSNKITPDRLLAFGRAVHNYLIAGNKEGKFTIIIASLGSALDVLEAELKDIDSGLNNQVSNTKIVDQFISSFGAYMSEEEPFIARALGGRQTVPYEAFYPKGITEYSKATKTTMPLLSKRVQGLAATYTTQLGSALSTALQAFAPGYQALYTAQQNQIGTVKDDRDECGVAFKAAQLVLTSTVCTVAAAYPGDVAKCSAFFPFHMLYSQRKRTRETVTGTLAPGESSQLLNRTINASAVINVKNVSSNSSLWIWLAASPDGEMPATAVEIAAGTDKNIKPSQLGNLKQCTFLMVKNTGDINDGAYEITFIGLKKLKQAVVKEPKKRSKMKLVKAIDAA